MFTTRISIALGLFALSAWAQSSAGVAGPVTGFVFDAKTGAIRSMLGIPGAAYLGNVVATGLRAALVAPDGSAVLAAQQSGKLVLYTGLRNAVPAALSVAGGIPGADRFAWAPDGSAAAVYSSATRQAQTVTGITKSPAGAPPLDLSGLSGEVTALAFDGQRLVLAVAGDSGGIYLLAAASPPQRIAPAVSPSALALAGDALYFADSQSQKIWQVQTYANTPAAVLFADDSTINAPAGLQLSADAQRLLVANAGNRKLVVYDIASRSPLQTLELAFAPTRLDRFGDASVFLMNGGGPGPLYVVRDGGAGKAAVFFVPPPANRRPLRAPIRPA